MGYFDALGSSYFKDARDGRKLFFPWGVLGRGYVIASEQDYNRLRTQLKIYLIVALVLIVATAGLQQYLGALIAGAALIGVYLIWLPFLLRGLQPSDESLSLSESLASQARAHSTASLWMLEVVALVLVVGGIVALVLDPGNWPLALVSVLFFGACAAVFTRMLILRRRSS